jgi:hypothetical protein
VAKGVPQFSKSKESSKECSRKLSVLCWVVEGKGRFFDSEIFQKSKTGGCLIPRIFKKPKQGVIHQTKDLLNIH